MHRFHVLVCYEIPRNDHYMNPRTDELLFRMKELDLSDT